MKSNSILTKVVLKELKDHLKRQGFSYKYLATQMGLSESGIKKIFGASDCSLGKIEKICQALGLSVTDLVKNAEDKNLNAVAFTKQQEVFFSSKEKAWLFYWLLVYERRSLQSVKVILSLTEKELNSFLFQMDKLNLLVLKANGSIRIPNLSGIQWVSRTDFVLNLYQKWSIDLLQQGISDLSNRSDERSQFLIRYIQMSEDTFDELTKEIKLLERRIVNKSISEMRLKNKKLVHLRWVSMLDQKSWATKSEEIE